VSDSLQHPNTVRVIAALAAAAIKTDIRATAESTRTAQEAADALGVEVGAIAKTLVFMAGAEPIVVVASGAQRIDTQALALLCGVPSIKRADADQVRAATGYPIGGVSPAALSPTLRVFVEKELAMFDEVWAAAGTPHAVFRTNFQQLVTMTGGQMSTVGIDLQNSEA
jgi:prolyl-tRNA editing enzyme YbaK/EbsC (Cys-tRNA(Pro) deacylase)